MAYIGALPIPVKAGGNGANSLTGVIIGNGTAAFTASTVTNHAVIVGGFSNALASVGPTATTGQVLQNNSGANPSYSTATYPSTTTINQLLYSSAANVVSGLSTANRGVLTTGATGIPSITALVADGQLIIGSTAGVPTAANLTAGTSISIVNAGNSITISSTNYVENTAYSPTLLGSSVAGTTAYAVQAGFYSIIGKRIFVNAEVQYTAATGTGNMQISLPFAALTQTNHNYVGSCDFVQINTPLRAGGLGAAQNIPVTSMIVSGASVANFFASDSGAAGSFVAMGAPAAGTGIVRLAISYLLP